MMEDPIGGGEEAQQLSASSENRLGGVAAQETTPQQWSQAQLQHRPPGQSHQQYRQLPTFQQGPQMQLQHQLPAQPSFSSYRPNQQQRASGPRMSQFQIPEFRPAGAASGGPRSVSGDNGFHAHTQAQNQHRQSLSGVAIPGEGIENGPPFAAAHGFTTPYAQHQQMQPHMQSSFAIASYPSTAGQLTSRPGFPAKPSQSWSQAALANSNQPQFQPQASLSQQPYRPQINQFQQQQHGQISGVQSPYQPTSIRPSGASRPGHSTISHAVAATAAIPAPSIPLLSRLPPLPPLPLLRSEADGAVTQESKGSSEAGNDRAAAIRQAYQAREEALMLRIEAIGFQPAKAWTAMKEIVEGSSAGEGGGQEKSVESVEKERMTTITTTEECGDKAEEKHRGENSDAAKESRKAEGEDAAPILGIRLLQRLHALEQENEELGRVVTQFAARGQKPASEGDNQVQSELQDAHELISAMDAAMKKLELRAEQAEARASANERALAVACAQKSSSILDDIPPSSTSRASGGGGGERSSGASRRA